MQQTEPNGLTALVERMRVNNRDDLFVIGAGERRITLYSQQVRALNLVYWLWNRNANNLSSRDFVVVGAGAAGLMVAAAAACLGARVTLLEANERPMAFQRGCRNRLLHPHYYEWPKPSCWKMSAGLPILDWDEGSAAHVAETICKQFDLIRHAHSDQITQIYSVTDITVTNAGKDNPVITWNVKGLRTSKAATVVLAVGFGVEKTVLNLPLLSYWRDDSLEQAAFPGVLRKGQMHHQLISGTGDGGLVDVLRASLWDFDHATFFSSFAAISRGSVVERIVEEKDEELWRDQQQGRDISASLNSFYQMLPNEVPGTIGQIDKILAAYIRRDYKVIWLHRGPTWWSLDSMRLNRLLVSRLLSLQGTPVETQEGELQKVQIVDPLDNDSFNYVVTIRPPHGGDISLRVHGVTVRHGPERALEKIPTIWDQLSREQRGEPQTPFRDALSEEPPTPSKYWEHDENFKTLLKEAYEHCQEELSRTSPNGRPAELCVMLPAHPNHRVGNLYRLVVHLAYAPADVRRVTYDLHPPLERKESDAEEPRKERSVVLEPLNPGENNRDKEIFKKLIHTDSDYTVRVRLDNGQEFISRLACGLCRHYHNHRNDDSLKLDAIEAVRDLLHGHPCQGSDRLANDHCLLPPAPASAAG